MSIFSIMSIKMTEMTNSDRDTLIISTPSPYVKRIQSVYGFWSHSGCPASPERKAASLPCQRGKLEHRSHVHFLMIKIISVAYMLGFYLQRNL